MENKSDYAIKRLKEFGLCDKYQNEIKSTEDGLIILSIICDELDLLENKTMHETYGDCSKHKCCLVCGYCVDCGDCNKYGCGASKY